MKEIHTQAFLGHPLSKRLRVFHLTISERYERKKTKSYVNKPLPMDHLRIDKPILEESK